MFLMVGCKKYQKIKIYQPRRKITRYFIQFKQYLGKKCSSPTNDNTGNANGDLCIPGHRKISSKLTKYIMGTLLGTQKIIC